MKVFNTYQGEMDGVRITMTPRTKCAQGVAPKSTVEQRYYFYLTVEAVGETPDERALTASRTHTTLIKWFKANADMPRCVTAVLQPTDENSEPIKTIWYNGTRIDDCSFNDRADIAGLLRSTSQTQATYSVYVDQDGITVDLTQQLQDVVVEEPKEEPDRCQQLEAKIAELTSKLDTLTKLHDLKMKEYVNVQSRYTSLAIQHNTLVDRITILTQELNEARSRQR